MDNGFLIYASGSDYIKQAYLCGLSIERFNNFPISLVTTDDTYITEKIKNFFDKIIIVPPDLNHRYHISNRSSLYFLSPYENTIVFDSDTIILENFDKKWQELYDQNFIYYPTDAFTYRNVKVTNNFYRKAFVDNNLPNIYTGCYFFKQCNESDKFYSLLKIVADNWPEFYKIYLGKDKLNLPSMDILTAITDKMLKVNSIKQKSFFKFIHMKNRIQDWKINANSWLDTIPYYINDDSELFVGNHKQSGVFHYVIKDFCNDFIIDTFEKL